MAEITKEEFQKFADDLIQVKNDVNTIKVNTELSASILSITHSADIRDQVFRIAHNQRLCKTLVICKEPKTAVSICEELGIFPQNFLRDIYRKLGESLLRRRDEGGGNITYVRAEYLDTIGFDKEATEKYPDIKGLQI